MQHCFVFYMKKENLGGIFVFHQCDWYTLKHTHTHTHAHTRTHARTKTHTLTHTQVDEFVITNRGEITSNLKSPIDFCTPDSHTPTHTHTRHASTPTA